MAVPSPPQATTVSKPASACLLHLLSSAAGMRGGAGFNLNTGRCERSKPRARRLPRRLFLPASGGRVVDQKRLSSLFLSLRSKTARAGFANLQFCQHLITGSSSRKPASLPGPVNNLFVATLQTARHNHKLAGLSALEAHSSARKPASLLSACCTLLPADNIIFPMPSVAKDKSVERKIDSLREEIRHHEHLYYVLMPRTSRRRF